MPPFQFALNTMRSSLVVTYQGFKSQLKQPLWSPHMHIISQCTLGNKKRGFVVMLNQHYFANLINRKLKSLVQAILLTTHQKPHPHKSNLCVWDFKTKSKIPFHIILFYNIMSPKKRWKKVGSIVWYPSQWRSLPPLVTGSGSFQHHLKLSLRAYWGFDLKRQFPCPTRVSIWLQLGGHVIWQRS